MNKKHDIETSEDLITKFEFLRYMPGYSGVKDINSRIQNMSQEFAQIAGWKDPKYGIGKTDYDIPCEASKAAELFIAVDKKVMESEQNITAIEICNYASGILAILDQKKPLINYQGTVIGIFWYAIDITEFILKEYKRLAQTDTKFISKLDLPRQYILTPEASPLPLSTRQQACLSLLIRGKTMKEIAFMLGISVRTVETHFETIKHKLGCYNKSELIEKAIDSGFLFHVSASLLGLNWLK